MTKAKRAKIERQGRKFLSTMFTGALLEAAVEGFMQSFPEKNMKITKSRLNEIAEQWSGAYRADYNGRAVSCQIIKAMFEEGIDLQDAKEIYFSKNLRWFFDDNNDKVSVKQASEKFKLYMKRNMSYIKDMFTSELGRALSQNGKGWIEA